MNVQQVNCSTIIACSHSTYPSVMLPDICWGRNKWTDAGDTYDASSLSSLSHGHISSANKPPKKKITP